MRSTYTILAILIGFLGMGLAVTSNAHADKQDFYRTQLSEYKAIPANFQTDIDAMLYKSDPPSVESKQEFYAWQISEYTVIKDGFDDLKAHPTHQKVSFNSAEDLYKWQISEYKNIKSHFPEQFPGHYTFKSKFTK